MAVYSPIPYIPQAFTIAICNLLTDNVAIIFYATKVSKFNCICYDIICGNENNSIWKKVIF